MKSIKKRYLFLLSLLTLLPMTASADNKLVMEPFSIKGGETKDLVIDLENDVPLTLVQFDLRLPEGLSVELNKKNKPIIQLYNDDRTSLEEHSISSQYNEDADNGNYYRVLLSSTANEVILGNSGPLFKISIKAESTFKTGTIVLSNIELVQPNETKHNPASEILEITLPKVTVTIGNATRKYGEANPAFTFTSSTDDDLTGLVTLNSTATPQSAVGDYDITGTSTAEDLDVVFVNGKLTVTPATLTVTAEAKSKTYGEEDPALTYTATGLVNDEQLKDVVTGALTRAEGEAVGTYAISKGTLAATANYTLSYTGANLTITAKTIEEPTITVAASDYSYDGTAKEPAVTVKDGETVIPASEYSVSYGNNVNAGTATVTIADNEGGNYAVSGSTTFAIAAKSVTEPIIELASSDFGYDGSEKRPAVTVKDGETIIPATEYSVSYSDNINVGTATVTITDRDGGNYTVSGSTTFAIAAKTVTEPIIEVAATELTYDGTEKEPAVTVKDGETVIPATEYTVSYSNNTNAGTATVSIADVEGGNYTVSGSTTFTIAAKSVTVTVEVASSDIVYDGTAKEPVVTVKDGETIVASGNYTVSYSNNTNAGTATVTVADKEGDNYAYSGSTTFSIAAKAVTPTITLTTSDYTYDGTAKTPSLTVKDGETVIPSAEYSVSYSNNTNAGTATVTVTDKNGGNYTVGSTDKTFDIAKAQLTVTAKDAGCYVGTAIPELELSYSGFKNGETESVLTTKPVAVTTATTESPAGVYAITVSGGEAQNYTFTYVEGKLTISEKAIITISAKNVTRVYGDENPTMEYTVTGGTIEGTPTVSCEAVNGSPVGEYTITVTKGSITTDANFVLNNATLTVTKAPLTVTVQNATREEGQENPTFELVYSGFKNGETESVLTKLPLATTTATTNSAAGDYTIAVSGGEAQNYDFTYVNGTLTISAKEPDGISTVAAEAVAGQVYTLSGQRVEKPRKGGLYIVNGRKAIIR